MWGSLFPITSTMLELFATTENNMITLAQYRAHLGLTQQAFADQLGLDIEYYKPLEYGKAPIPKWLKDKIMEYEDETRTT